MGCFCVCFLFPLHCSWKPNHIAFCNHHHQYRELYIKWLYCIFKVNRPLYCYSLNILTSVMLFYLCETCYTEYVILVLSLYFLFCKFQTVYKSRYLPYYYYYRYTDVIFMLTPVLTPGILCIYYLWRSMTNPV